MRSVLRLRAMPRTPLVIFLGSLGGLEDLGEGLVAGGIVLVAEAEFGVVEDRREDVVEFVGGRASEFAQGGKALGAAQLLLEQLELTFEGESAFRHELLRLHGGGNAPARWAR